MSVNIGSFDALPVACGSLAYRHAWQKGLYVNDPMGLTAWSDEYRMLPKAAAAEPGKWRTERTPYLAEIMSCLDIEHPCAEVVFKKSAQVGGTEILLNWAFWNIHQDPSPMMVVQPTVDMAEKWSKQRFTPAAAMMPVMDDLLSNKSRDGGNTTLLKQFAGGILIISGANSAASLRSMPIKRLGLDELDAYPIDLDGEGSPADLATQRTSTFVRRKILKISTPTIKDLSAIDYEFELSDQRFYHVPCPHCDHYQVLRDDNLTDDGRYVCEACGTLIEEHYKTQMLAKGQWIARNPSSKVPGFHLAAYYSPYGLGWSWAEIADKRAKAKGKPEKLKTYTNTVMGEPYEEADTRILAKDVQKQAGNYASRTIPDSCLILTLGVDVQGDRLACHLIGWGRGEKCWVIDYVELPGNPARPEVWQALTEYRHNAITNQYGMPLTPVATAIDTGGDNTHDVYNYCRNFEHERVMAIKGAKEASKPVIASRPSLRDVRTDGGMLKDGVKLWMIGVNTAKGVLYSRLRADIEGDYDSEDRLINFPSDLPTSYYEMLVAESFDKRTGRFVNLKRQRNESLDTWGYAYAAALHPLVRIHTLRDSDWDKIEDKIQPKVLDLFATASASPTDTTTTPSPVEKPTPKPTQNAFRRQKGGYAKRY